MKKEYIKPEMLVHQISKRSILLTSGSKSVYTKMDGIDQAEMTYGGYVEQVDEDSFDPD